MPVLTTNGDLHLMQIALAAQPAQFFCRGGDVFHTAVLQIAQRGVALAFGAAQGNAMGVPRFFDTTPQLKTI